MLKKILLAICLIIICAFFGLREFRKGHTFYKLNIEENLSIEFVYDYIWEYTTPVQAIIHRGSNQGEKTAMIDNFEPRAESDPKYDFIKSTHGIVGVFNKKKPDTIILLLDAVNMIHVPYISGNFLNADEKTYQEKSNKMVELFFTEYPNFKHSFFYKTTLPVQ